MSGQKIKVCAFSQQPLFQEGILNVFSAVEDIQIIGQAKVTDQALIVEVMPPDVVIVDMDNSADSSMSLIRRLKQRLPSVGIIVIVSYPSDDYLFQALKERVAAYLSKEIVGDQLADMVRRVARGEYPINESLSSRPDLAGKILSQFQELSVKTEAEALIAPLTTRETQVLNYVAQAIVTSRLRLNSILVSRPLKITLPQS